MYSSFEVVKHFVVLFGYGYIVETAIFRLAMQLPELPGLRWNRKKVFKACTLPNFREG